MRKLDGLLMELPPSDLEKQVDTIIEFSDKLAHDAMNRIVKELRKERE